MTQPALFDLTDPADEARKTAAAEKAKLERLADFVFIESGRTASQISEASAGELEADWIENQAGTVGAALAEIERREDGTWWPC